METVKPISGLKDGDVLEGNFINLMRDGHCIGFYKLDGALIEFVDGNIIVYTDGKVPE